MLTRIGQLPRFQLILVLCVHRRRARTTCQTLPQYSISSCASRQRSSFSPDKVCGLVPLAWTLPTPFPFTRLVRVEVALTLTSVLSACSNYLPWHRRSTRHRSQRLHQPPVCHPPVPRALPRHRSRAHPGPRLRAERRPQHFGPAPVPRRHPLPRARASVPPALRIRCASVLACRGLREAPAVCGATLAPGDSRARNHICRGARGARPETRGAALDG